MNWFGKVFKKKKKSYPQNEQRLLIIDDNAEHVHEILGISEKRAQEIVDMCLKSYDNNTELTASLEEVVNQSKHTNETVFITMVMLKVIEKKNSMNGLMGALKSMFGHG
jgi:hypothetical protein